MSRKNPFANLDIAAISEQSTTGKSYGMTGAAKTVVRSIEEMAENTKRLMSGETIVELDPADLDASFVSDRLSDDQQFQELKTAIKEHGQATPILVRPSTSNSERYMVVFGHRRAQVARELGITVKAVVKSLDDTASAIAQGQENSSRSNLSFIERAYFAQNLLANGMSKEIIKSAIAVDDAMLSKMLSVIEAIPAPLLNALGASKKIGRDKWLDLRQLVLNPGYLNAALDFVSSDKFKEFSEHEKFDKLHDHLKRYKNKSTAKTGRAAKSVRKWSSSDAAVDFETEQKPRGYSINLGKSGAKPFGEWLSARLDELYTEYKSGEGKRYD